MKNTEFLANFLCWKLIFFTSNLAVFLPWVSSPNWLLPLVKPHGGRTFAFSFVPQTAFRPTFSPAFADFRRTFAFRRQMPTNSIQFFQFFSSNLLLWKCWNSCYFTWSSYHIFWSLYYLPNFFGGGGSSQKVNVLNTCYVSWFVDVVKGKMIWIGRIPGVWSPEGLWTPKSGVPKNLRDFTPPFSNSIMNPGTISFAAFYSLNFWLSCIF